MSTSRHHALLLTLAGTALLSGAKAQGIPEFDRDIRPLLADRCFPCHGPDASARRADLRLDLRDSAQRGGTSGRPAVVPGEVSASELIRRIDSTDAELRMPPPDSGLSLNHDERKLLRDWIAGGADWQPHWAFRPLPYAVATPEVPGEAHPIDRFVRARLATEGLDPTPSAAATTLLRRAFLTLTGLPPDLTSQRDFTAALAAGTPTAPALRAVVDDLLTSERHAEHMAARWLDAARYADTYGYQSDVHRDVWPWRDWVLRSFRDNRPWDEFLTDQLAGDLQPDATRDQQLATTFLRLHRQTNEGGSVEEEFRAEYVADRLHTVGTAMLGLTMECARCHDHKFDPISQRDYYSMAALFDDIDESGLYSHFTNAVPTPALDLPSPEQERALRAARIAVSKATGRLAAHRDILGSHSRSAVGTTAPEVPEPRHRYPLDAVEAGRQLANAVADAPAGKVGGGTPVVVEGARGKALRLDGETPLTFPKALDVTRDDPFSFALWVRPAEHHDRAVILHRSRAWTDAGSRGYELLLEDGCPSFALIHFWPGDAIRIRAGQALEVGAWTHLAVTYDGSSRAAGLRLFVDGQAVSAEVVRDGLQRTIRGGGERALTIGERFRDRGLRGGSVDDLQIFHRELAALEVAFLHDPAVWQASWRSRHEPAAAAAWRAVFLARDEELSTLRKALRDARREHSDLRDKVRQIMTMRDMPEPRVAHVLRRGRYDSPGEVVQQGVPAALPPLTARDPQRGADRRDFAAWLTHPDHPLTARVAVDRVWRQHFGRGLVATPEDFGSQGARPTHPELLDWLARWFVEHDWDLRALHHLILSSKTWQQSSRCDAELRARDPDNALLARGPRFRLDAEAIRDSALVVGDALVERFGGPSVRPWQPAGLWKEKSGRTYQRQPGENSRRRSLYTYWKRTSPPPAMMLLDAAKRDVCVARRERTTTPLQALLLWNDPQYLDAAQALATAALQDGLGDPSRAIGLMLRRTLCRPPTRTEHDLLLAAWRQERVAFAAHPADAASYLDSGDLPRSADLPTVELAATTAVAGTLFTLDEFLTVR